MINKGLKQMSNLGAKPGKATLLQLSPPNTEVLVRYHLDRVSLRLRPRLPGFTVFEYFWYISNIPENYARRAYLEQSIGMRVGIGTFKLVGKNDMHSG